MITFRGLITAVVLVALSAVSLAAAWQVIRQGLDTSALGEPDEIFAWLARNDVEPLPVETQKKLTRRVEAQVRAGADPRFHLAGLTPQQQQRFQNNVRTLTRCWLKEKVAGYFARSEDDRNEYIDRELATILKWPVVVRAFGDDSSSATSASAVGLVDQLVELVPLLDDLIRQSGPDEQRQIQEFIVAVQNRAAAQQLFGRGRRRSD
jgi:hypothetical protein